MAVNINVGTQRHDGNANDSFEDASNQNAEQDLAAQPQLSAESGQYGDSGQAGDHQNPSAPAPASTDEGASPPPAYLRYGMGDTVITGRPDYANTSRVGFAKINNEREPADAPEVSRSIPLAKPIPLPKPVGTNTTEPSAKPPPALTPESPIRHAPRVAGELVESLTQSPASTTPGAPGSSNKPPTSSLAATPYSTLFVPGNANWEETNFTIDRPIVYPPTTPTRDASTMAEANAYAETHKLSVEDTAKLAALMANNHSPGREWLSLRPEVLASVLDAIKANPDGSFDVSRVFGGALGYYDSRISTPLEARLDENGNVVTETGSSESSNLTPIHREGWVYQAGADGGPGTYHVSDATLARYNAPYQPMLDAGFQQVNRNYTNDTVLSVGAEGGYRDLSQLEFNPVYGLISPSSNYIPVDSTDWADVVVPALVFAAGGAGIASLAGLGVAASAGVGSFVSTLGTTLDLRAALRSGAISFVSAGFAQWLTPQLLPGLSADNVIRQGVQSLISGTTAGALQGDIRQGFINGVTSFISLQIASGLDIPRTLTSALIRSFSDPNSALTGLLTDVVTGAVTEGANGVVAENDIVDRLMQEQPGLTPEQAHTLAQTMLATGRAIREINNGGNTSTNPTSPTFDGETAVSRLAAAYQRGDPTMSLDDARQNAIHYLDEHGIPDHYPDEIVPTIVVKPTGTDRELYHAERSLREARLSNDPEVLRNAAIAYNNVLVRQAGDENLFFSPTPFNLISLGLINPNTGQPATAQDFENRVPHFEPGTFAQSYYSGQRGLTDPNADWIDRSFYTGATAGVLPLFLLEEMGRGLLNAPNAADRMMQYIERASFTTDADERILASLQAVQAGSEAILGLGVVVPAGTVGGIATNELRAFTSLGAAREAFAEAAESSGGLNSGVFAGQHGAVNVVAILDSGRLLIQQGERFFEFVVSQRNNRVQFTLTRDLTTVVDEAAPNGLSTGLRDLTPGQVTNIERRINTFDSYVDPATGLWSRASSGVSDAAYTLERNLMAEGKLPPGSRADYTPHHMVEFDPGMVDAQRILNDFRINPNEAANGVWLDRSYHQQLHTLDYQAWVTTRLENAAATGGRDGVVRELERIATDLRNHKPIPPRR